MILSEDQNSLIVSIGLCDCDNRIVSLRVEDILKKLKTVTL